MKNNSYEKILILEKKLKTARIGFFLLFVFFIILAFLAFLPYTYLINFDYKFTERTVNISYCGLSNNDIKFVDGLVDELKPQYLNLAEQIIFTNNYSMSDVDSNQTLLGVNYGNGRKVYVVYRGNPIETRYVLCHELLHSLMTTIDVDTEEWFVDDIEKYGVCYK